jgi:hypothetical protein
MKLSVTKTLWDGPTLRQNAVGNARGFHPQILDMQVRQRIDQIDRALGRVGVETILEERRGPPRHHRGTGEAMVPGNRHPFSIETG